MAGITSVGTTGYQQYYVSNTSVTGPSISAQPSTVMNSSRQRANKESANLTKAAQELKNSLKAFSNDGVLADLFANGTTSSSFQVMARDSLDKLVNVYNKFNEITKSSKYITGEGSKLLNQVQELLTGKNVADYRKMGLEIDKQSGNLKFDDKKFAAFFDENTATTGKLLINDKYFVSLLQDVAQSVLGKQSGYYFVKPLDVSV
ncbi:hypothetical protein SDC9_85458 [bioreactor metagenome]|uniref:Flagellar hook-associated protein 2 C-terminal domain-containing protein n=1 Tax=bioreactor metagenome TaxID=1076179 RepID=A0A644ZEV7_9ZZZZ